jgi:hypothetical protein
MESLIAQEKGVRSFHKLRLRRTGPSIVADVHIVVDSMLSVSAAHQIAEQVRFNVMSAMQNVSDLLVHIDVGEDADTEDRLDAVCFFFYLMYIIFALVHIAYCRVIWLVMSTISRPIAELLLLHFQRFKKSPPLRAICINQRPMQNQLLLAGMFTQC